MQKYFFLSTNKVFHISEVCLSTRFLCKIFIFLYSIKYNVTGLCLSRNYQKPSLFTDGGATSTYSTFVNVRLCRQQKKNIRFERVCRHRENIYCQQFGKNIAEVSPIVRFNGTYRTCRKGFFGIFRCNSIFHSQEDLSSKVACRLHIQVRW